MLYASLKAGIYVPDFTQPLIEQYQHVFNPTL